MTTEPTVKDEIRVRRGRLQALDIAAKIHWNQPEEADALYRHEQTCGTVDELLAGSTAMLLSVVRSFAELTGSTPEAVIDALWQQEAHVMVTLADIDQLPTVTTEQEGQ
ncbi:hypothetical protein [Gordonia iterans]